MKVLDGLRVLAWRGAADGALARFLHDLGAELDSCDTTLDVARVAAADLLIEQVGLARIEEMGLTRRDLEAANPRLIHVSVTTFGSSGPRARWRGSELVASATSGILRLVGDPDRPPVKEALDACGFHADMVAACGALRRAARASRDRQRPARRRFGAGSGVLAQRQWRAGVAVRSAANCSASAAR